MKIFLSAVAFGMLATGALRAQTPVSTPEERPDDIVRITTSLIQVDATVTDKKGNIVRGLTPADFEVYENGKKQKISNLSFVEVAPPPAIKPNNNGAALTTNEKVPPLPVKLRPDQIRRTIALVVDDLGLSFSSIGMVRNSLKKFVDEKMEYGDLVAIIRTGSGVGFLQQFTSDKRILYAAIDQIKWNSAGTGKIDFFRPVNPADRGAPGVGTDPETVAMLDAGQSALDQFRQTQSDFADEVFSVGSLGAVNYVIDGLSRLPGRKSLVFFSDGFKLYTQDAYERTNNIKSRNGRLALAIQNLTENANRNAVSIYPVDAKGVENSLYFGPDSSLEELDNANEQTDQSKIGKVVMEQAEDVIDNQQGLRKLAEDTGGVALINNNDLERGIDKALADQSGYYLIAYEPEQDAFDPKTVKFNTVDVKLTRPDLRVRSRKGYYGIKDADLDSRPKSARRQVYGALTSPLNFSEFKLRLASFYGNDSKNGNFIRTMIHIDGPSLTFHDTGDGWQSARFDITSILFGEKDLVVDEVSRIQTVRARAETLDDIKQNGFVASLLIPIKKPGGYQMRVVVRDDASAKIGSASEFIKVPNIKKDQLYVSGILLQRVADPAPASAPKPFQPAEDRDLALRTFRPGMKLRLGFGVYNPSSPDIRVRYRIFQEGVEVYSSQPSKPLAIDRSDAKRVIVEDSLRLSPAIKPGSYIVQVIVEDTAANRSVYGFTDFEIE